MTPRSYFAVLALAVVAALGLAACGGGDDTGSGAPAAQTGEMAASPAEPSTTTPAADLRATLDRLLGEHAVLAMVATQKGYDGAPDFEAVAAALDQNGVELSQAIGSVYGDEAALQFLDGPALWRDHIGFFVDYTVGLAKKDEAAQQEAVENLTGYTGAFSGFLAEATGLPQDALQESTTEHVMQLKGQIDAYAAGDYEEAYRLFRQAYEHMVMTGDTLADAIVKQNPDEFGG
ncbi:MAG: hypothetical protein ACRDNN_13420 [Gaiellaceae bacterium]